MMLNKASARIWTLNKNNYVRKNSHPINLLIVLHNHHSIYKTQDNC